MHFFFFFFQNVFIRTIDLNKYDDWIINEYLPSEPSKNHSVGGDSRIITSSQNVMPYILNGQAFRSVIFFLCWWQWLISWEYSRCNCNLLYQGSATSFTCHAKKKWSDSFLFNTEQIKFFWATCLGINNDWWSSISSIMIWIETLDRPS